MPRFHVRVDLLIYLRKGVLIPIIDIFNWKQENCGWKSKVLCKIITGNPKGF